MFHVRCESENKKHTGRERKTTVTTMPKKYAF